MSERTAHPLLRMSGRDPHEDGRTATPLELLFDLTFVIAFGAASDALAHQLAAGHVWPGVLAFGFATFGISWAWINFTWFASAFDTDDWVYRLTTMVQMVGVLVLALGMPPLFESVAAGEHVDNSVIVLGYIVMRVAMVLQWLRARSADPDHARACAVYVTTIMVAQLGWVGLLLAGPSVAVTLVCSLGLYLVEASGPVVAERRTTGTPWHAHHIAERYGLLVIIALGEGLIGTVATLSAIITEEGWTLDVAVLGVAGVGLTFGLWWTYFVVPNAALLHAHRERSFGWGYGHIPLFGAVVAVGSGLHVAAYRLEHHAHLTDTGTVLAVVVPIAAYVALLHLLQAALTRTTDLLHLGLVGGSAAVLLVGVLMVAVGGVPLTWTLLVVALTPWVTVVGQEVVGHRSDLRRAP